MEVLELLEKMRKYAELQDFRLNPDANAVITVLKGMLENEKRYGYRYCPCRPITGDKGIDALKICPCKWHKDEIKQMGHCFCELFAGAKD